MAGATGAVLGLALGLTAGCGADRGGGRMEASWTGADTGRLTAPATANWCPGTGLLEVVGTGLDTGVALVLYPGVPGDTSSGDSLAIDDLRPGRYPLRDPFATPVSRPGATAAIRWFDQTAVQGYSSHGGEVVLERGSGGALHGRFRGTMRSPAGGRGELTLEGSFVDVPLGPAAAGCPPAAPPG
ncbi:MAG TPA: hypothetical protein VNK43_02340 [Gemmatimonadales bacterium]|nr:hypothetical protein [Gemmatimonadales bacterium]